MNQAKLLVIVDNDSAFERIKSNLQDGIHAEVSLVRPGVIWVYGDPNFVGAIEQLCKSGQFGQGKLLRDVCPDFEAFGN